MARTYDDWKKEQEQKNIRTYDMWKAEQQKIEQQEQEAKINKEQKNSVPKYDIKNNIANNATNANINLTQQLIRKKQNEEKTSTNNINIHKSQLGNLPQREFNKNDILKLDNVEIENGPKVPTKRSTDEIIKSNQQDKENFISNVLKKSEAFDDGYQFGDVSKTVVSTLGDIGYNAITGIQNFSEGIADKISYGIANYAENYGKRLRNLNSNTYANKYINFANNLRKVTQENIWQETTKSIAEKLDKNSISGTSLDNAIQGVGQSSMQAVTSLIPGGQFVLPLTTYLSSSGSAITQALQEGATPQQAEIYGMIAGAGETITEYLAGGITQVGGKLGISKGVGELDDKIAKKLTEKINSQLTKNLIQMGVKASGEGLEEVLSGTISAVGKKVTYMSEKELSELIKDEKLLDSFLVGALSAGISQAPSMITSTMARQDYINLPTTQELEQQNKYDKQQQDYWNKKMKEADKNNFNNMFKDTTQNLTQTQPNTTINQTENKTSQNELSEEIDGNKKQLYKQLNKNGDFSNQLDLYKEGKMKSSDLLYVKDTPEIYTKIGMKENPITLLQKDLKKVITEGENETSHNHGVPIETLKNLPNALDNPLNILKSIDDNGNDCIVVITDLADTNERPIIVSLQINDNGQIGNIHFDTNRVTSIYGKRGYDNYMMAQIEAGNMLYDIDEGIIKELPASTGLQSSKGINSLVDTNNNVSTSNNSIPQNNNNVNDSAITNKFMQNNKNNTQNTKQQIYENTGRANKLIKEKNALISNLEEQLKTETNENTKNAIQQQINEIESSYNSKIQDLYNKINNLRNNENLPNIANNQKTLYNSNESESDLNVNEQRGNLERDISESRLFENSKQQQTQTKLEQQYRQWEKSIESKTNLTDEEQQLKQKIKQEEGKDIIFIEKDNNQGYNAGASLTDKNIIYINTEKSKQFGLNRTAYHEVMESKIRFANEEAKDIITSTISDMIKDNTFENQKNEFWKNQKGQIPSDTAIAKDIICDRYAELKGEKLDYNNVLSEELNNRIDMAIEYFNQELDNSSILMPTKENTQTNLSNKNVPFRNTEEIAKDTKISDLDAIREESQKVNMPSLESAENAQNTLREEGASTSPTIDYIKSKRSKEKVTFKQIKDTIMQKFVNKGHYIYKLAKQTGNSKLIWLYDRTLSAFNEGTISIAEEQINIGKDGNNQVVGESLIDIFEPAQEAKLNKEFDDYLFNKHNIQRYEYEKGIYGKQITSQDSSRIVEQYEKTYPQFKEWAEKVYKYNDNNLKDMLNNNLISQDMYNKLKEMYGNYVPTYRDIVSDVSYLTENKVGNNALGRAKESNLSILSVQEAMAEQTIAIKKTIRMNNLGIELYNTLQNKVDIVKDIEVDPLVPQVLQGDVIEKLKDGTAEFTIFQNGEMTTFKISDELYTAFNKDTLQNKINNSKFKGIFDKIAKVNKFRRDLLTTYSITFGMKNAIKDKSNANINTKFDYVTYNLAYAKAATEIATKSEGYKQYLRNGVAANSYFNYEEGILPNKKNNIFNKIESLNEAIEQVPRYAEYLCTLQNGGSVDEALYNASEVTTNFKRGGDITKVINKYGVNFLNASVQGLDKTIRNITGQNGVRGYTRLLVNATIASIAPSIINGLLYKDDDDYDDLPDYIKDNYYVFKTNDNGDFVRIPKGNISSVLGGIARRILETAEGKDVDWSSLWDTAENSLAPTSIKDGNLLAPIIQSNNNKAWYGGDIVSTRLQKLPIAEQYDESTDEFSKWIGKTFNISPKKVNYLLDQYSGGIGDIILPMMTPQAENNVIRDQFTTNSVMKNKHVSEYFSMTENLEKIKNSENATDEDILKYNYFTSDSGTISNLYKQKREIQNSNLPNKEKQEKVKEVQKQINEIVENKLETVDNVKIDGNIATVGNQEYYKKTNMSTGEKIWTQLTDEEKEKNKDVSLNTYVDYKEKIAQETIKQRKNGNLKEDGQLKDKDKIQLLLNSNYSNKETTSLYENYILNSTDKTYKYIKSAGIDINAYLEYKLQEFNSDKIDNGTLNGKKDKNGQTKQEKMISYLNKIHDQKKITGNQSLFLYAIQGYKTTSSQKSQLVQYVQSLKGITNKERLELYNRFSGFTVYKDGTVKW